MPRKLTQEEYIKKAQIIHNYRYDYSKTLYTEAHAKVIITCLEHGDFIIQACNHTNSKQGCPKCAKNYSYTTEEFIQQAQKVHGNVYNYDKTVYVNSHEKIIITCPIHGDFLQQPYVHLRGHHCNKCGNEVTANKNKSNLNTWVYSQWEQAGNTSNAFEGFSVYILECWDDRERFIKIGKTFTSLARRLRGNLPYEWKLLHQIQGSARYISELEQSLHNNLQTFTYTPTLTFGGQTECYVLQASDYIYDIFNK